MWRLEVLCLLFAAMPVAAQHRVDDPPPVAALPGVGRAIDVDAFASRRARLAARVGTGAVLIPAASRQSLASLVLQDNDFRQDDYFFYLTGLESPDAWLLVVARDGVVASTTLLLPSVNSMMVRWTGVQLGPGETAERLTGIAPVVELSDEALVRAVGLAAGSGASLLTTLPAGADRIDAIDDPRVAGWHLRDVVPVLDSLRQVKDALGLAALRRAVAITGEGVVAGMRAVHPGMWEYQLEAVIEFTFRSRGADRVGYPSIVGSGANSTTLHYDISRRRMEEGDLVVVDVGAEYAMYTADITRTFPVSGRFTERQRAIYELVLGAENAVIAAIEPGVDLAQLNAVARAYLTEHGAGLCGTQDCNRYFIHGVGHWLGMRVHDVGDNRRPLEPGMVLTVEPGIYIPDEQLGVRIEDDVLVTEDGAEVLSIGVPKTVEDIERIVRSDSRERGTQE